MEPIIRAVITAGYYSLDCAGRIGKDFDASSSVGKAVNLGIKYLNIGLERPDQQYQPLSVTIKTITDSSSIRGWTSKLVFLLSGQAAGVDGADRIWLTPTVSIPNVLKIVNVSAFLACDFLGSLNWLDTVELIHLGKLSENMGSLPFFGKLVVSITLQDAIGRISVIGLVIDLADATRDICQNGLTFYNGAQVIGDVAKLVGIAFAASTGHLLIIAIIADGTAIVCSLSRFVMRSYNIGM